MRTAFVCAALAALSLGGSSQAATTVLGNGLAGFCSQAAKSGEDDQPSLEVCTLALETESMSRRDRAGTHVNRGVIKMRRQEYSAALIDFNAAIRLQPEMGEAYVNRGVIKMRRQEYAAALVDFNAAIRLQPEMGEAYVNRGGALVGQKRYMEALLDIDKGLGLNPEEPEKAYYNRALANEGMDDIKAAYFDYLRAVELAPEWDIPKRELLRFTVVRP